MPDSALQAHATSEGSPGCERGNASNKQPNGAEETSTGDASLRGSNSALEDDDQRFSELLEQNDTPSPSGAEQMRLSPFTAGGETPEPEQNGMSLFDTDVAEQAAEEMRRECHALATSLQEKGILLDPSGRACSRSPTGGHTTPLRIRAIPKDEAEQQVKPTCLLLTGLQKCSVA